MAVSGGSTVITGPCSLWNFSEKLLVNDQFRFLGNCPPTPPLSQHFALSEKQVLMLDLGRGRWAASQKPKLIGQNHNVFN